MDSEEEFDCHAMVLIVSHSARVDGAFFHFMHVNACRTMVQMQMIDTW